MKRYLWALFATTLCIFARAQDRDYRLSLSPGAQNLWAPIPGSSGNTVPDIIGGQTGTVATGGSLTYAADGALVFSGGQANRVVTPVTSFLTLTVAFVPQMPTSQTYEIIASYSVSASTFAAPILSLSGYANGSSFYTPNYLSYASYHLAAGGDITSLSAAPSGSLSVITLVLTPFGTTQMYLNGLPVNPGYSANITMAQAGLSHGFLEFGGSPLGVTNCAANVCGFNGKIYAVLTNSTSETAPQVQNDYNTLIRMLTNNGVNVNQTASVNGGNGFQGSAGKPYQISCFGESGCGGHGLANVGLSYTSQSAYTVNGGNAFAQGLGRDSNDAYEMSETIGEVYPLFSPMATNIMILASNGNGCKSSVVNVKSPGNYAQSDADLTVQMAHRLRDHGFMPVITDADSAENTNGDAGKDLCNPPLRAAAFAAGIPFYDRASDIRIGADGASSASNATNATACSGTYGGVTYTAGPVYQSDSTHQSACYNGFAGKNLGVFLNRVFLSAPATTTAATYTMSGTEDPLTVNPSTASQTITLIDCIGQSKTSVPIRIVNLQATGANTVTVVPLSAVQTELINGQTSITVPNGKQMTFTAYNLGDTTAGCGWTAQ